MSSNSVEKFISDKGQHIADILLKKYDSADFEVNANEIERDIYDTATTYAKILYFETETPLEESTRKNLKLLISTRFDVKEKQADKMSDIDLIAHSIKLEVIERLSKENIILI